jgi:hypothetical protein
MMIDSHLREELLKAMERLSPERQRRVVEFAGALRESWNLGTPTSALFRFTAAMRPQEAEEIFRSIEEDREQVDPGKG